MVLWWIGNLLLIAVVAPVVVSLLRDVLSATKEIHAYAGDALEHLEMVHNGLNASLTELNTTRSATGSLGSSVQQYGRAVGTLL